MSIDDSGATRLPDEYYRLVERPGPYAVAAQPPTRRRLLTRLLNPAARRQTAPRVPAQRAPEPPGGVPAAFVEALRGGHDLCRVPIGQVTLSVAFTAGHGHRPDAAREVAAWAGTLAVFRTLTEDTTPAGVYTCAPSFFDQARPVLPPGVDAIAWRHTTGDVYAARPGCPRRSLRRLRTAAQPRRLAAIET